MTLIIIYKTANGFRADVNHNKELSSKAKERVATSMLKSIAKESANRDINFIGK